MLGIRVTIPVASFRKALAREYLETELIPPPATCYGFLLSLVGETDRRRHIGCRVGPVMLRTSADQPEARPPTSVVLRTVWRVKKTPLGSSGNTRPDYQQLLSQVDVLIWCDSSEEIESDEPLEARVRTALERPETINRFGGLSLGESTHLVNDIWLIDGYVRERLSDMRGEGFVLADRGRLTLPVWVDHVGAAGTNYVTGNLEQTDLSPPPRERMPRILPKNGM